MRLDRLLVTLAQGSRTQVQRLIRAGSVTVGGRVIRDPSFDVSASDAVALNARLLDTRLTRHLMLHKPAGILTAARDPKQPTVMDLLPPEMRTLECMPVGRLDKDTTGLLLFTTDGTLAHRLLSPERHVEKEYLAVVDRPLTEKDVAAFAAGLNLGNFTAMPAELKILESASDHALAKVIVKEGKFHQVKRMFEAVGREVTSLHRERFGPLVLGDLPCGEWRELTMEEIHELQESVGMR
jgi:16S rRNA pseudouridine516 synthase